tara:strand:+ start:248 stop:577 length:330 start_codon:yes stop_codon:yes gene_type:complete
MEKGEQTTNNDSCLGDSAQIFPYTPHFFAKASLMENNSPGWGQCTTLSLSSKESWDTRDGEPSSTPHTSWCRSRDLSVMENQEDGDPCSGTPGLGKPYEYGDGHGSCAQ